jgi:hypothetical protein
LSRYIVSGAFPDRKRAEGVPSREEEEPSREEEELSREARVVVRTRVGSMPGIKDGGGAVR